MYVGVRCRLLSVLDVALLCVDMFVLFLVLFCHFCVVVLSPLLTQDCALSPPMTQGRSEKMKEGNLAVVDTGAAGAGDSQHNDDEALIDCHCDAVCCLFGAGDVM